MSSVIRTTAQIGGRVKYLIALQATNQYVPNQGATINSIITDTDFSNSTQILEVGEQGTLYKDLGGEVTTVILGDRQFATYRLVQRVNGFATEGVPNDYPSQTFYIQVWSAQGGGATVARLG